MKHLAVVLSVVLLVATAWACSPVPQETGELAGPTLPSGMTQQSASSEKPLRLKVAFTNYTSNAPVYFALKEGYFSDAGLDVELVTLASSNEVYPALASGQVDVVLWTLSAALFNAVAQGVHMKFVADKGYSNPDACASDAWMASKQALASGLSGISTLKGRTIVSTRGSISEYSLDLMLAHAGLSFEDVVLTQISDSAARVEALRTGSVDLAPIGEPWITYAVSQGAAVVWRRYSDILPRQSLAFVAYGPNILDHNREAGIRFMTAYLRGVEQFNEGKTDRNVELISEYTKISPEDLRAACWNSFKPDGIADEHGLLAYQDWLISKGTVDKALPLDQFWTADFVKEAARRLGH